MGRESPVSRNSGSLSGMMAAALKILASSSHTINIGRSKEKAEVNNTRVGNKPGKGTRPVGGILRVDWRYGCHLGVQ